MAHKSHKKKFSDAVLEEKMSLLDNDRDDSDRDSFNSSLGSESSDPCSDSSLSSSSLGTSGDGGGGRAPPPARIHRAGRVPKKDNSQSNNTNSSPSMNEVVPPLHLASPRNARRTITSFSTFEPPTLDETGSPQHSPSQNTSKPNTPKTEEEKREEEKERLRKIEAAVGDFSRTSTAPPSPMKSPRRKTLLSAVPASPKTKPNQSPLEKGSQEGFELELPASPRDKKKKAPPPTNIKRGESEEIEAIRNENKNLQMTLKFKEKEIADLKKRLEKEQKKNTKKESKKSKKEAGGTTQESLENEEKIHSPAECPRSQDYFNSEFHLGNMSKDDCTPLNQYLLTFGKRSQSPEQARRGMPQHAESMDAVTKKRGTTNQPWVIDPAEVQIYHELSRGSSAHVLLGVYRSQLVAVKVMKSSSNSKHIQDFKQEFQFAQLVKSSYNVYFYGVVFKPSLCLVMEYCERKSLHDLMRDKTLKLTWKNTLKFMYDFVKGVSILHNWVPPLVHRDIKSMNILITADWQVKLCDFGLTRATSMSQMEGTLAKVRGTYTHCAPEVFKGGSWSLMSDMYSVAVVMWEMCYRCVTGTHQIPYAEFPALKFDFQILMKASAGLRPSIPDPLPDEMKFLIQKGWHENPENRLSANELLNAIHHLMENYDEQGATWPCMDG